MSDKNSDEYIKENEAIVDSIFNLFKGKSYSYVKGTLKDCLAELKEISKVR